MINNSLKLSVRKIAKSGIYADHNKKEANHQTGFHYKAFLSKAQKNCPDGCTFIFTVHIYLKQLHHAARNKSIKSKQKSNKNIVPDFGKLFVGNSEAKFFDIFEVPDLISQFEYLICQCFVNSRELHQIAFIAYIYVYSIDFK